MIVLRNKQFSAKYNPVTKRYEGKITKGDTLKSAAILGTTGAVLGGIAGSAFGSSGARKGAALGGVLGAGLIAAGRHVPKIYEQQKAVRTGMEINTKNRLEKSKKKERK